eukprot:CAMPEP_0198143950 /NCGR_PEP_ID=MMETSP1443-20131203/11964_1 /TAXON_ID=186043 /ORGANISM="Entomoneis sp., Strain CCMP2396" /LENGTH=195 /DNA_ID=CAMNT_0043807259 /DNA_START=211 /DNA_END=798 /DNA_ORIENTATION=-
MGDEMMVICKMRQKTAARGWGASFLMLALVMAFTVPASTAFTVAASLGERSVASSSRCGTRTYESSPLISEIREENIKEDGAAPEAEVFSDANGMEFAVGNVARVCKKNVKAYQVPKSGKGSFNKNKEFVPDEESKYLILPVGLRGIITKLYNVEEVSANFPILVKFVPGELTDEGYSTPVKCLMHFSPNEVECV